MQVSFSAHHGEAFPSAAIGLVCDKCILGCQISDAIDLLHDASHLPLEPVVMPILLLVKSHKKLLVIECTSALLGSLCSRAVSGFS